MAGDSLRRLGPRHVPLPGGTKVSTLTDAVFGERSVPQGAVGRVVSADGDRVRIRLPDGQLVVYPRDELVPTKLGQARYAVRREQAWQALRDTVVVRTVVGSRAWGLADEGSDTDRRGVFVLPFTWTTSLVVPPEELVSADGSETCWEIGKTIRQALRADPNTLEMLFLGGADALDPMGRWLLDARDAFASQEIYGSFGRYALSQLAKLRQSLRLAEHRTVLGAWLREHPGASLDEAARRLAAAAGIEGRDEAERVARAKEYIKQLYGSLHDQGLLAERAFPAFVAFAAREDLDLDLPRRLRPKNAYNLIRLLDTATHWLANGTPRFEVAEPLRSRLLDIKRGEVPLEDVVALAESMVAPLDEARARSPLPRRADVAAADQVLRRIRNASARRHFLAGPGVFGADAPEQPPPTEDEP